MTLTKAEAERKLSRYITGNSTNYYIVAPPLPPPPAITAWRPLPKSDLWNP